MEKLQLQVKSNRFLGGEEYPLLVDTISGLPLWYPTLYATTQFRNKSSSSSSINANLQAIRFLLDWAQNLPQPIDLKQRFLAKNWLLESERESIKAFLLKKRGDSSATTPFMLQVISLNKNIERIRRGKLAQEKSVSPQTLYHRLGYVAEYIAWFATKVLEEEGVHLSSKDSKSITAMKTVIKKMRTVSKNRNQEKGRRGLTDDQRVELLEIIEVNHPRNPFKDKRKVNLTTQVALQSRNQLLVWFGYYLGIRDGEALNIRIKDLCFQTNTVLIARRADAIEDPRTKQPKVKTRDRRLVLANAFAEQLFDYITRQRNQIVPARKHDYLFVTHKRGTTYGAPLSQSAVEKMFRIIRGSSAILPNDLSMHVLRHTANDRFSEMVDKKGIDPEKEKKMRSYQNGWTETSNSAAGYTKRHTSEEAHKASLELQEELESRNKNL
tara:strand:- start:522 stop:1838 length:1317 start_codon:yes stop_codon:yes gene_type:complete